MSRIEQLAAMYRDQVSAPWPRTLAGAQRVMMIVYEKEHERALRARMQEFEHATRDAGHAWKLVDCTGWFAEWMVEADYREEYFEDPSTLTIKLPAEFGKHAVRRLGAELEAADDNTVVGVMGIASLFGFLHVSELVRGCEQAIRGRLLVLFPGTKDGDNYRLLDARDGWNYLAQAITLHGGTSR